ncbi:MAG: MBG domain-containing protein [Clostridia bacterium]
MRIKKKLNFYLLLPYYLVMALWIAIKQTWQENGYNQQVKTYLQKISWHKQKVLRRTILYFKLPYYVSRALLIAVKLTWQENGYQQKLQKLSKKADELIAFGSVCVQVARGFSLQAVREQLANSLSKAGKQRLRNKPSQQLAFQSKIQLRSKIIPTLLIILLAVNMVPMNVFATDAIITDQASKDIFLNVDSDAGYDTTELANAVRTEITRIGGTTAPAIRLKTNSTSIDTTNLANWYVYDHYDTAYWTQRASTLYSAGQIASNDATSAWKKDFGMNSLTDYKRPYTGQTYTENSGSIGKIADIFNPNTVQQYDQHIWSGAVQSGAFMTFVGYGVPAYMDYLFYPDKLSGTKTVTYTINSTDVALHTLKSAGFLCNTGIDASGFITGYILVYTYTSNTTYALDLYPIKSGITAQQLTGTSDLTAYCDTAVAATATGTLTTLTLTDVKLTITPNSVKVEQKAPADTNFSTMKDWTGLTATAYNGFGPYVKYTGHGCSSTSSYKFSNLKMSSSTDAGSTVSALASLQNANYLDDPTTDKYLVNVLGENSAYNLTKDENYLALVQNQSLKLFTNKSVTPIASYLPDYYVDTTNTTLSNLATSIATYILGLSANTTTTTPTTPSMSSIVANFTLTAGGVQVSQIKRELITTSGVVIDVDNKSVAPSGSALGTPTYKLTNPAGTESTITVPFTVTNSSVNWPTGDYLLKMDYGVTNIPATVHFSMLEDVTAPTAVASKNGNFVDVAFTNQASSGTYSYTADLDSYVVENTSTTAKPSSTWENEVKIINNSTAAAIQITQAGYMHILVKDKAGNIGHTYLEITQVFPTITAPTATSINFGQALSASTLQGGAASYNSSTVAGAFAWANPSTKPVAGNSPYSVRFTPNAAMYATMTTDVAITVHKVSPSITLADKAATYSGNPIAITAATVTGVSGMAAPTGVVTYSYYTNPACDLFTTPGDSGAASEGGVPVFAGKYYVVASIASDSNYLAATTVAPGTLTILPNSGISLAITGVPNAITYGDASFTLATSGGSGTGTVTYASSNPQVAEVTQNGYVSIKKIGSAVITATKATDGNFSEQTASTTLNVAAKAVTYTITNNSKPYTGEAQYASVIPDVASLVEGVDYTIAYAGTSTPTAVGEYAITVTTINENYVGSSTAAKLTIQAVDQSYTMQIGGLPNYLTYEDSFALYANGGNGTGAVSWEVTTGSAFATISSSGLVEITGVGQVTITVTKASDGNYNQQKQTVSFTTNKKHLSVSLSNTAKTYNGAVQAITLKGTATKNNTLANIMAITYELQANGEQTAFRNVGTYNVSAAVADTFSGLYILDGSANATASIAKANLVITAADKSKTYGDINPALTLNYTLLGTDTELNLPTATCTATTASAIGDYDINLAYAGEHGNGNYNIALVKGKLTVIKRIVTVTWQSTLSFSYDSSEKTVVANLGNAANNDSLNFNFSGNNGTNVNGYSAAVTGITGVLSSNYELPSSGLATNWSITKAPLTITADNRNLNYGAEVPTYTASYAGFVGSEGIANLGGALQLTCIYAQGDNIGEYTITPAGFSASNYELTFISGKLTCQALPITIYVSGTPSLLTVQVSPAFTGLTLADFMITADETTITPTKLTEISGGAKYYLAATLLEGTEYTLTVQKGTNYNFNVAKFIARTPLMSFTPQKTITVTENTSSVLENSHLVEVQAEMYGAFPNSVEVKITDNQAANASIFKLIGVDAKAYPFDISIYDSLTKEKVQPSSGYKVKICLPLPKELWATRESVQVVYIKNGELITLASSLESKDGVWCIVFAAEHFSPYALVVGSAEESGFKDVHTEDWFNDAVTYVTNAGIMAGTSEHYFSPALPTTRGMMVTMLYRLAGLPQATKANGFKDVASGKLYSAAVDWAAENGIVLGYDAASFKPEQNISRQQLAAMVYRYAKYKNYDLSATSNLDTYVDTDKIGPWALANMNWVVAEGLFNGNTKNMLTPKAEVTRAQVATIFMRFMEKIVK